MNNPSCDLKDPNNPYSLPTETEPYPQFPQQIPPPSPFNQELPSFPSSPGQSSQNVPNFPQNSGQYIQNVYFGQFNQPPPPQLPISRRRQFGLSLGLQSPNLWQRLCSRVWKRKVFALR